MTSFRASLALAFFAAGFAARTVHAAPPLTLSECVERATAASPAMAANKHDIAAAEAALRRERAAVLPFLSGALVGQTLYGEPVTPFALANVPDPEDGTNAASSGSSTKSETTRTTTTTRTTRSPRGVRQTEVTRTTDVTRESTTTPNDSRRQTRTLDFPTYGLAALSLQYPIFSRGSFLGLNDGPAIAYARSVLQQQRSESRITREDLVYEVSATFLTAVWSDRQFSLDREITELLGRRFSMVKEEVTLGLRIPEEAEAARRQLSSANSHADATRALREEARLRLARRIGSENPGALSLAEPKTVAPLPPLTSLFETATQDHPQIHTQELIAEQARQQYRLARSAQLPTVSLQSSYAAANDGDHPSRDLFIAGVRVDVPIFDFGDRRAATRQAQEKWLAEQARVDKSADDLFNAVADAYSTVHSLEFILADAERELASAEVAVKVLESKRDVQLAQPIALIDAQLTALARRQLVERTRYQHRMQLAALQRAVASQWKWAP